MLRIIVKNLVIIGVILGVAFLSQQPFSKVNSKNYVYSSENKKDNNYLKSAQTWLQNNVLDRVSGGVRAGKTQVAQAVETQKENTFDDAKKNLAEKILNVLGVSKEDLGCKAN